MSMSCLFYKKIPQIHNLVGVWSRTIGQRTPFYNFSMLFSIFNRTFLSIYILHNFSRSKPECLANKDRVRHPSDITSSEQIKIYVYRMQQYFNQTSVYYEWKSQCLHTTRMVLEFAEDFWKYLIYSNFK